MKQFFTLIALTLALIVNAQSISLETSFATNGIKSIPVNGEVDRVELLDFDNSNFLVYSKTYNAITSDENLVFKINTDGTFDTSFGTSGKLILPNYSSSFQIFKQGVDKFIVAFGYILPYGSANNESAILRYNSNGLLDTTFGTNGEIRINGGERGVVVMNDFSILSYDSQAIMKFTTNGVLDTTYGVNGVLNVLNNGKMFKSYDGDLVTFDTNKIEKKDLNGNFDNSFGTNGSYTFPMQNDYLCKSSANRFSFIEVGNLPVKFYDLNANGTLNTNFNSNGNVNLTSDNNTLEYYEDFLFDNNVFYFVGNTTDLHPFIVCYDANGNLLLLNNSNSYKESSISNGGSTSILIKNNTLYVGGDFVTSNNDWSFTVSKYNFSTTSLSVSDIEKQNQFSFQNPIQEELKINTKEEINSIEIYALDGKRVQISNSILVDTSCLSGGIYLLQIKFKNGKTEITKMIKG